MAIQNTLNHYADTDVVFVDDPYDLIAPACTIHDRILAMKRERPHQKIVVLMGEYHDQPSQVLLPNIVQHLCNSSHLKTGIALEVPHNFHNILTKCLYNYNLDTDQTSYLNEQDPSQNMARKGLISNHKNMTFRGEILAHRLLHLLNHPATFAFVDLPFLIGKRINDILDISDPYTKQILESMPVFQKEGVKINSKDGLTARNYGMFGLTKQFQERTQADVTLVQTGQLHVHGSAHRGIADPNHSLSKIFNDQKEWNVLSISQTDSQTDSLSDIPQQKDHKSILIHGSFISPYTDTKEVIRLMQLKNIFHFADLKSETRAAKRTYKKFVNQNLKELHRQKNPGFFKRLFAA